MAVLQARLMGNPKISIDSEQVYLPFRKAEALLYYLIVKKQASRELLVGLLWGDTEEETAKKNLRNAVYIIRKTCGYDVLISPQRHLLMLNKELELDLDLEFLLGDKPLCTGAELEGEFLEGFMIKEAEYFERWMFDMRESLMDTYVHKAKELLRQKREQQKTDEAEALCRKLIGLDPYNEEIYRELIEIYSEEGKFGKCTDVFNELTDLLNRELSITPDERTVEVFEGALAKRALKASESKIHDNEFMYGRQKELQIIREKLAEITRRKRTPSIVVVGEAGIGKSMLVREALKYMDNSNTCVIKANCYQAEENYALKPWNTIFEELGKVIDERAIRLPENLIRIVSCIFPTFIMECGRHGAEEFKNLGILQYQVAEKAIIDIIKRVSEKVSLVFCFEDIQWMDEMSLGLLRGCIHQFASGNFLMITTCRNEHNKKVDHCITELSASGCIGRISLDRLNEKEILEFSRGYLPGYRFTEELDATMIKETEGNTFFLVEFLNGVREGNARYQISAKMKDVIRGRIMNVSEEGQKLLNIASLFFDRIIFEDLLEISGKTEDELADLIEELQDRYLINEFADGSEAWFCFTHQKLREYIYNSISVSKRKILHNRIAKLIEGKLDNSKTDALLYSKLIHHYENAGNRMSALKFRLQDLNEYIHVSHELFPILESGDVGDKKCFYLTKLYTAQSMNEIRRLIDELNASAGCNKNELLQYELLYLYLEGRSAIRQGEYDHGLETLNGMIQKSLQVGEYLLALKGYRSIIYYGINTFRPDEMEKNLILAKSIASRYHASDEMILLDRLEGILEMMKGNYQKGEELLKSVIAAIGKLTNNERFTLIEAGSYYYLGEIRRMQGSYEAALELYEKGIELCKRNAMNNSATIFYAKGIQVAYLLKDRDRAVSYLEYAVKIYRQYDYPWGKTTALGYGALCRLEEGRYEECLDYVRQADESAQSIKSPIDLGIVLRVKAQMAYEARLNSRAKRIFQSDITGDAEAYCRKGIQELACVADNVERDALYQMLRMMGKN